MKILILRFSSIGDIVLTTPVIRCLKNGIKKSEIHYATKKQFEDLLSNNPYVNKTICLNDNFKTFIDQLREEKYDLIIDLHNNLRTKRIKAILKIPSKTFNKLNFNKWLLTKFKIDIMPKVHIVDRYMDTLKKLNIENDGEGLDYFMNSEVVNPKEIDEKYIAVAIGGQHFTKKMPNEKLISILNGIDLHIVLLGGKDDVKNSKIIAQEVNCTNLVGLTSLDESAMVIRNSEMVLTHDTGLMHIAAAFKKPIYSLWGNTVPAFGMSPYYGVSRIKNVSFELKGLNCRPCSKIGFADCPKGHFKCMNDINNKEVIEAINISINN